MYDTSISVVIPVYRRAEILNELNSQLVSVLSAFKSYEIIYVDDASPDNSFEVIENLAMANDNIIGIALETNYGQQNTIFCGLRNVSMDLTVIMDDDLEHNPEDIFKLYHEIRKGVDVVYALNSAKAKTSLFRSFGSLLRDITFNMLTDKPRDVKVCSFRMLKKDVVEKVCKAKGSFVYISMEILKHTQNIGNIFVEYGVRGSSGHSMGKLIKILINIHINYSKSRLLNRFRKQGTAYQIKTVIGKDSAV